MPPPPFNSDTPATAPQIAPESDPRSQHTRQVLLEIAGEEFGQKGFAGATIRSISQRANVNIAAINYHFGDKAGLYAAALAHAKHQPTPAAFGSRTREQFLALPAPQRLEAFIIAMLHRVLDRSQPHWHTQLWVREMIEPTRELESVVATSIKPNWSILLDIVCEITSLTKADERAWLATASIVSQVLLYRHCAPVLQCIYASSPAEPFSPTQQLSPDALAALGSHISQFSLAGLHALRVAASTPNSSAHSKNKDTSC